MNEFHITDSLIVKCTTVKRRPSGFAHVAEAFVDDKLVEKSRVAWENRTWEEWPYKTVLAKLADNTDMTIGERKAIKEYLEKQG